MSSIAFGAALLKGAAAVGAKAAVPAVAVKTAAVGAAVISAPAAIGVAAATCVCAGTYYYFQQREPEVPIVDSEEIMGKIRATTHRTLHEINQKQQRMFANLQASDAAPDAEAIPAPDATPVPDAKPAPEAKPIPAIVPADGNAIAESDAALIQYLKDDACYYGLNVQTLEELLKGFFSRHPMDEIFLEPRVERCIKRATDKKFDEECKGNSSWKQIVTYAGAGAATAVAVNRGIDEIEKFRNRVLPKPENTDAYVIGELQSLKLTGYERCKHLPDIEKFKKMSKDLFKRSLAHEVFLSDEYEKCVEVHQEYKRELAGAH